MSSCLGPRLGPTSNVSSCVHRWRQPTVGRRECAPLCVRGMLSAQHAFIVCLGSSVGQTAQPHLLKQRGPVRACSSRAWLAAQAAVFRHLAHTVQLLPELCTLFISGRRGCTKGSSVHLQGSQPARQMSRRRRCPNLVVCRLPSPTTLWPTRSCVRLARARKPSSSPYLHSELAGLDH